MHILAGIEILRPPDVWTIIDFLWGVSGPKVVIIHSLFDLLAPLERGSKPSDHLESISNQLYLSVKLLSSREVTTMVTNYENSLRPRIAECFSSPELVVCVERRTMNLRRGWADVVDGSYSLFLVPAEDMS